MSCSEHTNVYAALLALLLSIAGFVLHQLADVPDGPHAESLQRLSERLETDFAVVAALNAFLTAVVCFSNYDCCSTATRTGSFIHCLSKANMLFIWSCLAWCTFLVQLLGGTFSVVWFVMVDFLDWLCQTDAPTIAKAQELIWKLGNMTHAQETSQFHNYGHHIADTPFISLEHMSKSLNLPVLCSSENYEGLDHIVNHFWIACLLTTVSQAFMAVAMNGEKERVAVHELHESESMKDTLSESLGFS